MDGSGKQHRQAVKHPVLKEAGQDAFRNWDINKGRNCYKFRLSTGKYSARATSRNLRTTVAVRSDTDCRVLVFAGISPFAICVLLPIPIFRRDTTAAET